VFQIALADPPLHRSLALLPRQAAASLFPWDLAAGLLVIVALLLMFSRWVWNRHRARAVLGAAEPDRLSPYLLNGAAAIPALTAWLIWLLGRIAPLTPLDRTLVALAVAWVLSPFAAFGLSAAGEALTRTRGWPSTHV
jgi:hypothetical protein